MSFSDDLCTYQSNVSEPMQGLLAEELGLPVEAVAALAPGYYPAKQAWVFAERDETGAVIGLTLRRHDGKKFMVKESKRGLFYALNPEHGRQATAPYMPGAHNWLRVEKAGVICPICGKKDWCLVSARCTMDPEAVICGRVSTGAASWIKDSGFLHIRKPAGQVKKTAGVLVDTELPIIIVEGASDVMAAAALGFQAIGRPNDKGGLSILKAMPISGKKLLIIGENDAGAGVEGMEVTYETVKSLTAYGNKILPPKGIKDLRGWVQSGLTQKQLLEYAEANALTAGLNPDIFEDDSSEVISNLFIRQEFMSAEGKILLRNYHGSWLVWQDGTYQEISDEVLRGKIYSFVQGKKYMGKGQGGAPTINKYKATRSKINDLLDAMNMWCPVTHDPPCWLITHPDMPGPEDLVAFQNGILDMREYVAGRIKLYQPNPDLFTFCVFPYAFDENARAPLAREFFTEIFDGDSDSVRLMAQWFGYNCVPDMSQEKLMLFTGRPRSGKSTSLEMLEAMLGRHQCCAVDFSNLISRFGRQPMLGKLAATLGDVKTPRASESEVALQTILRITGQDPVGVDRKGVAALPSVRLVCRFTMAMNELPMFSDHSRALVPRMNVLYFPHTYVGREDKGLKLRLKREAAEGKLINFALKGLADLRRQGTFTVPGESDKMLGQLETLNTPILVFLDECCVKDAEQTTEKSHLYDAWCGWCNEQGRRPGMREQFGRWLLSACPEVEPKRVYVERNREWAYSGIGLQEWAAIKFLRKPV